MLTAEDISTIRRLLREALAQERKAPVKPLWAGPRKTMEFTGWNQDEMRKARAMNWVEFKRTKGRVTGYKYNLNSIDSKFIKQTA